MADKKIVAGIVATIAASLCCVTPVLAVLAGSSSLASSFSWLEPYHNVLVVITILVLLYAWWDKLKPKSDAIDCACDEKQGFFSSKLFLGMVTLFALIMLTFPLWGASYFETEEACHTCTTTAEAAPAAKEIKKSDAKSGTANGDKAPAAVTLAAPACSGIGYKEADDLLYYARQEGKEMEVSVLKKMLDEEADVILLDVREAEQRAEGEIYAEETYAMTRGNLEFRILNMIKRKDAVIVAYCRSGGRSAFAAQTLRKLGYKNAISLKGGLKSWVAAGYPFENGLGVVVKVEAE